MATARAAKPPAVTWRSAGDLLRHAYPSTKAGARAVCGARLQDERFHRPDVPRHAKCEQLVVERGLG